ncbi:hypothetical protein diail_3897 [Diaporthe ilicicola]|nr:hypothetical protein diail_3897 [Diaporthe ilicicola]
MGVYRRRQLRAACSLLLSPFAFAVRLTCIANVLSGRSSPPQPPAASSSSTQQQPDTIPKALVVASTTKEDTSWLSDIPASLNWTINHYRVPSSRGNEAMRAWHQRLGSAEEVARLRPGTIVPLACGEPAPWSKFPELLRKEHLVTLLDALLEPGRFVSGGTVPEQIAAPCCAQFAVSRGRVLRRSHEWWVKLREWLIDEVPLPSMNSGRLMEHLWHVFFGMEPMYCPSEQACRCHVFGLGGNCESYFEQEKYM